MTGGRTQAEVRRYDLFKAIIALILLIILILLLLRGCGSGGIFSGLPTEEEGQSGEEQAGATEDAEAAEQQTGATELPTVSAPTTEPALPTPMAGPTPTAAPSPGVVIPVITAPTDGAELPAGDLLVQGTAAPGAEIELVENGAVIATTQADGTGHWQVTVTPDPGQHTYTARPSGDASSVSGAVTVTIRAPETAGTGGRDCPPDGTHGYQPDEFHYVVGSCDTLSGIAAFLGVTVEALLAANPQITDPNLIFPGQVINVP